ncbi:hypothetical protein EBR43_06640 [bacterium]|nr:hypothetical protein [bacterium]
MPIFKGTAKADTFTATAQADIFYVNNVGDVITGGDSQDTVYSFLQSYELTAGLGNLVLSVGAISGTGNAGSNVVQGNALNNTIDGGAGQDILWGGKGADTFVFSHAGDSNCDQIQDYTLGVDKIAVRGSAFGLSAGVQHDFVLNGSAVSNAPTFIRMGTLGTAQTIYFDVDGIGSAKAQAICTVPTFTGAMSASDFSII